MTAARASNATSLKTGARIAGRRRNAPVRLAPLTARDADFELDAKSLPLPESPNSYRMTPFNRRVDVLETERSHGRISVSQYEVGRQVQAILERSTGARLGSVDWNGGGSKDQTIAHELAIIYAVDDARLIAKMRDKVVRAVGRPGSRFLIEVMTGRQSFAQFAEARGRAGEKGTAAVANHFRILLEYLDDDFAAEGVRNVIERFFQGEAAGEETDREGRVVPPLHGETWGVDESRYAGHMNERALDLAGRSARVRDRVSPRARRTRDDR